MSLLKCVHADLAKTFPDADVSIIVGECASSRATIYTIDIDFGHTENACATVTMTDAERHGKWPWKLLVSKFRVAVEELISLTGRK